VSSVGRCFATMELWVGLWIPWGWRGLCYTCCTELYIVHSCMIVWIILVAVSINTRYWIMLCHYEEVASDSWINFCRQEPCIMRVNNYFIGSFYSVRVTGTFAQVIFECTTCTVNNIAVCLCLDAYTSINIILFCITCLNCFDTLKVPHGGSVSAALLACTCE
jgi:hypothetical protein